MEHKKAIIIIGAGAAGLGAARWLVNNDIHNTLNVIVVEARDRIGGRVNTSFDYDIPIDLGAAWLHDHKQSNPISIMAKSLNISLKNTNFEKDVCYNTNNVKYSDREASRNWSILEKAFVKAVKSYHKDYFDRKVEETNNKVVNDINNNNNNNNIMIKTDLETYIKKNVTKVQWDNPLLQAWCADYDFEFGTSIKNLSPAAIDEVWIQAIEKDYDDYDMMFDKTGYIAILNGLVTGAATENDAMKCRRSGHNNDNSRNMNNSSCNKSKAVSSNSKSKNSNATNTTTNKLNNQRKPLNIHLNHRVICVTDHSRLQSSSLTSLLTTNPEFTSQPSSSSLSQMLPCSITLEVLSNHNDKVKVNGTYEHNSPPPPPHSRYITMYADVVLCTLPLGVLKSHSVTFNPDLSPPKQSAIEQVGMGNVVKVVMEFSEIFWSMHSEFVIVADESLCCPYDSYSSTCTTTTTTTTTDSSLSSSSSSSYTVTPSAAATTISTSPSTSSTTTTTSTSSSASASASSCHLHQQQQQHRGLLTHFWSLYPSTGRKILVGFGLGDAADMIDQMTDCQLEMLIRSRMLAITTSSHSSTSSSSSSSSCSSTTGAKPLPSQQHKHQHQQGKASEVPLVRWSRTQWATDPFSYGAYSYVHKDFPRSDIFRELGRCESECLWFAGEAAHTHSALRATVTGAWLSGVRAAEGIVRSLYKRRQEQKEEVGKDGNVEWTHSTTTTTTATFSHHTVGTNDDDDNDDDIHSLGVNTSSLYGNHHPDNHDDDDDDDGVYTPGESAFIQQMITLTSS